MSIKSTSIIAAAILATTATPSFAGKLDGLYANIRIGISASDADNSETKIDSYASRIGYKAETDLGNGLTGFGKLEYGVDADDNEGNANSIRQGLVGLKGNFGELFVGQSYHTFYNFTVGPVDKPWWNAGHNMLNYTGRTAKGLTYKKSMGDFAIGATAYLNGENDGTELGLSYNFGGVQVSAGVQDLDSYADSIAAFTVAGKSGDFNAGATFQKQGDNDSLEATFGYKNIYLQTGTKTVGDVDTSGHTLGYTHSIGAKTTAWFELFNNDDSNSAIATLKYDIF